jgi:hypothetical protein
MKEDINKLPKWARQLIEKLKADVSFYNERLSELKGEGETNVYIQEGIDTPIPLPKDSRIIFKVDNQDDIHNQIMVNIIDENIVEVRSGRSIKIIPRVSNSIYIEKESLESLRRR